MLAECRRRGRRDPHPRLPSLDMSLATLRPRTFTELVDASFAVFRDQYTTLTVATSVLILPLVLVRAIVGPGIMAVLLQLMERVMYAVGGGAIGLIGSGRLLGRRPGLGAALRPTFERSGSLLVSGFLRGLA